MKGFIFLNELLSAPLLIQLSSLYVEKRKYIFYSESYILDVIKTSPVFTQIYLHGRVILFTLNHSFELLYYQEASKFFWNLENQINTFKRFFFQSSGQQF